MRKLIPRTAPAAAFSRPPAARPGQRSGEGADSVLPGLREDAAQRPERAPDPAEHPSAGQVDPATAIRPSPRARSAGSSLVSRLRLSRPTWTS